MHTRPTRKPFSRNARLSAAFVGAGVGVLLIHSLAAAPPPETAIAPDGFAIFSGGQEASLAPIPQPLPHFPGPPIPAALEGLVSDLNPTAGTIRVMGVLVAVPAACRIHTPVTTVTLNDLIAPNLPGRTAQGFDRGTAIVTADLVNGWMVASDIAIEPGESVLSGAVTSQDPSGGGLWILGVRVEPITDWRLHGVIRNEQGFVVNPATVRPGTLATAMGYLGNDGVFHAYAVDAIGDIVGAANQTTITRAQCTLGGSLEVRGSSTSPSGSVTIRNHGTGVVLGVVTVTPDPDVATLGNFRLVINHPTLCPGTVRAENSNGSQAIAPIPTP